MLVGEIAGSIDSDGYIRIAVMKRRYPAHRLAWFYVHGEWPCGLLDHKDTIRHHNWIDNLRIATPSQNLANIKRARNNTSGFKGVTYGKKARKWYAQIRRGKRYRLGPYETPQEAHAAYVTKATELYGEFARAE